MALVAHLEGPKVEGVRKPVYFKTHVDHVEGLTGVFTGASASSAGSSGNVPPPQIGDENKFLCGNGTWSELNTAVATISTVPSTVEGAIWLEI